MTYKMKFVFGRVENILGKREENAAFHPFPTMFSKGGGGCVCVILDWSKLKSYAYDKLNVAKIMISFSF